jgi:Domain of unknown function (DUF5979)
MTQDIAADAGFAGLGTGDAKSPFKRWAMLFLMFLFVAGISSLATASGQIFSISKNICTGVPSSMDSPQDCELATQVSMGTPVYYVITITSPWGQAQQQVDLIDDYEAEFSPTPGGLFCIDGDTGNAVSHMPSGQPNGIASVTLNMGQTIHCFVPGTFNAVPPGQSGNSENTVTGINKDKYDLSADVETKVLNTTPLNADLSITKTADSSQLNVTGSSDTLTYTITITNNGTADVDVGDFFKLYDKLSLLPNGVPFNVDFAGATCTTTVAAANANDPQQTECLDPAGPNLYGSPPTLVGTTGQTNFFNWGFAPGADGHINAGDSIVLTITIKISQLDGLDCVAALNADGLRNTAFFNLTNSTNGTAYSEINNLNNTASVDTAITTGQTNVVPGCGKSHLRLTKKRIAPADPVAWGAPVTYEITIENASVPNQPITINQKDLQDWVTQGINTPSFTATHLGTGCVTASDPGLCASFNANSPTVNDYTPLTFAYYGHTQKAWDSVDPITLNHGENIILKTQFVYEKPDCSTVPNAKIRPIFNTAKITYMATPYGGKLLPPSVTFTQDDTAMIQMEKVKPCDFTVTKDVKNEGGAQLQFGVPFDYIVTYTNNGPDRDIGTIMDAVRIDIPGYASSLPFTSSFKCSSPTGGVSGFNSSGGYSSGFAVNTTTPAQGSPAANIGSNVNFQQGSTLECQITMTVNRPPFNDKFCTTKPAKFENLALMDTTNPFNNNIFWPPSSTYTFGAYNNPPVQNVNWATASLDLPKCWDAIINKSASVAGLPQTNAPWTYPGNPNAINYSITTTNTSQGTWGDPTDPNPGWVVTDGFVDPSNTGIPSAYYDNTNVQQGHSSPLAPVCNAAGWCWPTAPHDGTSTIGVKNLTPGENGVWNIQYTGKIKNGEDVMNCAEVSLPAGTETDAQFYSNFDPKETKRDCVKIPVVEVTKIPVIKVIDDQTGAGIKDAGPFGFSASCSPFPLQTVSSTFSLSTTSPTGTSPIHNIYPVPVNSTSCTITETSTPAVPNAAIKACQAQLGRGATAVWQTAGSPTTLTGPLSQNVDTVKIVNSLVCVPPKPVKLTIIKRVENPTLPNGQVIPPLAFPIDVNCSPAATPNTISLSAGTVQGQGTVLVQPGATCTVTEPNPPIPPLVYEYCRGKGMKAQWVTNYFPANPIVVGPRGASVTVSNKWECVGDKESAVIKVTKILKTPFDLPRDVLNSLTFTINANCTPAATPSSINIIAGQTAVFNVQLGAVCTFTETLPPMPDAFYKYCERRGMVPEWNPPVFAPGASVTIKKREQSLEVINTFKCVKKVPDPYGTVNLIKRVDTTGMPAPVNLPPQNYTINIACAPGPVLPSSVTLSAGTTPGTGSFSAPIGAVCTMTEPTPSMPAAITAYCRSIGATGAVWDLPTIPPVTVSGRSQTIAIVNKWHCTPVINPKGSLEVIKEVTNTVPGVLIPPQTYPITVSCAPATGGPATVTQLPLSGWPGASGMVNNIPVGSTCTVTEQTPSTPALLANMCANQGKTFQWDPPVYVPASGSTTIVAGVNVVRVKNTWSCVGGTTTLTVTKRISNPGSFVLTNMNFSVTANCTPGGINTQAVNNGSGMGSVGFTVPVGAICTVTENTPLPTFPAAADQSCGPGKKAAWKPPFLGPNNGTVTVGASGAQVFVTNAWECVPIATAELEIIKSFTTPALPVPWPQTMWTFNANCNPAASQTVVNINTNSSSGTTITGSNANPITVPIGATCVIVEPAASLPVFSSAMSGIISTTHCGGTGHPEWNSPTYTYNGQTTATPPTITAAAGVNTVRVNNSWSCVPNTPAGNQLEILKSVQGPLGTVAVPPKFSADYIIQSNCSTASTPGSVSLNAQSDGTSDSDVFSVAAGANCNLMETAMPAFPAAAYTYCTTWGGNGVPIWEAPTFTPSSNVTIGSSGVQTVNVLNKWKCVMNHPWMLNVIKTVQGPAGAPPLPVLPYVITRNCTGVAANGGTPTGSVTINTATTSTAVGLGGLVTVGAHCALSEVQPPLPQSAQTYCDTASPGSMAKWNDPVYSLPLPIAGDFPTNNKTVTVTNSWFCLSSAKVAPKKKKKPKFKINIGIGIGGGGGGGDKPKPPRDPQPRP